MDLLVVLLVSLKHVCSFDTLLTQREVVRIRRHVVAYESALRLSISMLALSTELCDRVDVLQWDVEVFEVLAPRQGKVAVALVAVSVEPLVVFL